jgi:hypothetical protein
MWLPTMENKMNEDKLSQYRDVLDWYAAALNFASDNWDLYAVGYKRAADLLIDQLRKNNSVLQQIDTLVYPIMFLYRHYLELRLKQLYLNYSQYFDKSHRLPVTHKLETLWQQVKPLLLQAVKEDRGSISEDDKKAIAQIETLIMHFAVMDENSMSFRYPVDRENNPLLPGVKQLNIASIQKQLHAISSMLDGASFQLDVWEQIRAESLAAYYDVYSDMMSDVPEEYRYWSDSDTNCEDLPF